MCEVKRGDEEVERRCEDTDSDHHGEVLERVGNESCIVDAQSHTESHDRSHERRDEHGADDDGNAVDVESDRCDDDGEEEDVDVRSAEIDIASDIFFGLENVEMVAEVGELEQIVPNGFGVLMEASFVCHLR